MSTRKSDQALAAINLLNLGSPPETCVALAAEWARRSRERSGSRIAAKIADYDLAVPDAAGSLFLSFHHSDYGIIYPALAAATGAPVYAIIGAQEPGHAQALTSLAASADCDLRFIESGLSMVKQARRVMVAGSAVLLLIDVPWTQNGAPTNTSYSCGPGAMLAHASLARLISLISKAPKGVLTEPDPAPGRMVVFECPDLSVAYARFGQTLMRSPSDYERLDKLHRYFRPNRHVNSVVCFAAGNDEFALHGPSGAAWRLNRGVVEAITSDADPRGEAWRAAFTRLVGSDVDVVIAL